MIYIYLLLFNILTDCDQLIFMLAVISFANSNAQTPFVCDGSFFYFRLHDQRLEPQDGADYP